MRSRFTEWLIMFIVLALIAADMGLVVAMMGQRTERTERASLATVYDS